MEFKSTTIAPHGRNKYGAYISSGNITKKVTTTVYAGNGTTNDLGGGKGENPPQQDDSFVLYLSKTSGSFDLAELESHSITETIAVTGYNNTYRSETYIGVISGETYSGVTHENYDIIGLIDGMSVNVVDNATSATTIELTFPRYFNPTDKKGVVSIPVSINMTNQDLDDKVQSWEAHRDECQSMFLEYQWEVTTQSSSPYILDLTNDSASVNCDSAGTPYAASIGQIHCKAVLKYGAADVEDVYWTVTADTTSGYVMIDSNGELSFASNLNFEESPLEIFVGAKLSQSQSEYTASKIMTLSKNFPGIDGSPAVSRWIVPSTSQIVYNPNTETFTPSRISAKVMKQVGDQDPVEDTTTKIYYGFDTQNPNIQMSTYVEIDELHEYLALGLKKNVIGATCYEVEYLPFVTDGTNGRDGKDGKDGKDGEQGPAGPQGPTGIGRAGAAVRGPIEYQPTNRRWCSGDGEEPEDTLWIDIIYVTDEGEDPHYYRCVESYDGHSTDTWEDVQDYWEEADGDFEFVATKLLLAENGKINFLTNNELYLINRQGDITGGARGSNDQWQYFLDDDMPDCDKYKARVVTTIPQNPSANSESFLKIEYWNAEEEYYDYHYYRLENAQSINFWAGSDDPAQGNWKVYNDGSMKSTKGQFGCLEITADRDRSVLYGDFVEQNPLYGHTVQLEPEQLCFKGTLYTTSGRTVVEEQEVVRIVPFADTDRFDPRGIIEVDSSRNNIPSIYASGDIRARNYSSVGDDWVIRYAPMSRTPGLKIEVVNVLPATKDPNTIYFVK